jgi:hypothetical protein
MELDATTQVEGVTALVVAHLPALGQPGQDLEGARLELHQPVVQGHPGRIDSLGRDPAGHVKAFRIGCRTEDQGAILGMDWNGGGR